MTTDQRPTTNDQRSSFAIRHSSAKVAPTLLAALDAAPDGRAAFLVYLKEQADLSLAYAIQDWKARGEFVYRTLRETAQRSQKELLTELRRQQLTGTVTEYRPFFIVNAIAVTADRSAVDALAAHPGVAYLVPEPVYHIPEPVAEKEAPAAPAGVEWNVAKIRADRVWSDPGVTGEGVVVAAIGTGVDYTHPALVNQYRGTATGSHDYNWFDPTGTYPNAPGDNNGHGTRVMSILVGDDGAGNQIGVAPGAQWLAAKGCVSAGCNSSDLLAAAEWMLAPCPIGASLGEPTCDPAKRPQVVNNAWGGAGGNPWFEAAVSAWRAAGIFPTFAVGGGGPGDGTISSPADYAVSFATGATSQTDTICSFSARGPSSLTAEIKPDVVAPGCGGIRSAKLGGGYETWSGTSAANAHTSGVAALVLAANPNLTVQELETLLTSTAVDLGPAGPDYTHGYGRIDAYAAVTAANDPLWWLSFDPTSGGVEPGSQTVISVTLNAADLYPGIHAANLLINSNDPDEPTVTVPVTMTVTPGRPKIAYLRVSNIRDVRATVSWITIVPTEGRVYFGTDPANLTNVAYDDRGSSTIDNVHHVTLANLSPETTYYFYVVSDGTVDDNDGNYYQFTTGVSLGLPLVDNIWGQVFWSDGTPAAGLLVYLRLVNRDGFGSPGRSGLLSGLTDSNGYWIDPKTGGVINLGAARTEDGTAYFNYSSSGDMLLVEVWAGNGCHTALEVDTDNDSPAPLITLSCPAPTITSLSPSSTTAGGPGFTLTLNGTDFLISSVVRWSGSDRPTTFLTSTLLTAEITDANIATAGTASVTVFNPAPGGGTSNAQTFTINNPIPTLTSLSPISVTAGGPTFTLTVNGTNFVGSSVVRWNGSDRTTTFVGSTQLRAEITATDIATPGTATVTVFNPAPGGGISNALTFHVNPVAPGDDYEPDNTCDDANAIAPDGSPQTHNIHTRGDADWVRFNATANTYYVIAAIHVGDDAHPIIRIYDACNVPPYPAQDPFGYDSIVTFYAERDGLYYIRLTHNDPNAYGDDTAYQVSVRPGTIGAAIIVGGRQSTNETLQSQITFMTNRAYQVFRQASYPDEAIYYLSADPIPPPGRDALSLPANLQDAIQTWAPNQVQDGDPLYLYLVDHGLQELFYLNAGQRVTPEELDAWLLSFQNQKPHSPVILILEACRSGSFVTAPGTLSRAGRIILTATGDNNDAYVKRAGQGGAYFSDAFFTALAQSYDIWQSFQSARQSVRENSPPPVGSLQTPWIDGNGNGVPYPLDRNDEGVGRSLGLGRLVALSGGQAPFIEPPVLPQVVNEPERLIQVRVVDEDLEITDVWMELTKPSTPPPSTPPGSITPMSHAEQVSLTYNRATGRFEIEFVFDEVGGYQLVFNARDRDNQYAQAVSVAVVRDVNGDGVVNVVDVQGAARCWGQSLTESGCRGAEIDNVGAVIDVADIMRVVEGWIRAR